MSGSESNMRTRVVKILSRWDAMAVENRVGDGTPDVAYIGGWIETKLTKAFPKRPESPVALTHGLLNSQKVWMARHHRKGGTVHVLTQIANEFFLHEPTWAIANLGSANRQTMTEAAVLHCVGWPALTRELPRYLFPHSA